ncbi:hypothetical protein LTR37_017937 [Vermiconidia calcicola]|uniref:Uncharacterized protein n=1 Tax=Vermiconidia calcicola TaxID=1690605 RepID=A0ACC3MIP6_9PEZI|nr:hypothetical protein LTR37_017937 [Vermiconidia calcicola]
MRSVALMCVLFLAAAVRSLVLPSPEQFAFFQDDDPKEDVGTVFMSGKNSKLPQKIAIIGSGITGATAAYNLREGFRTRLPADQQPSITVFERNLIVGGRITQAFAYGDPRYPVDTCAATYSLSDSCISTTLLDIGLTTQQLEGAKPDSGFGVWNGKELVGFVEEDGFREPEFWSPFRTAKWFQRYGNAPWNLSEAVSTVRLSFDILLDARLPSTGGESNLTAAIEAADLNGYVQDFFCSGDDRTFPDGSKGSLFVEEVAYAAERERFFASVLELNVLEYVLSYETARPVSVQGGNLRLIDRLLRLSTDDIRINTDVLKLERLNDNKTGLTSLSSRGGLPIVETFDTVIVATSLELANITFEPLLPNVPGLKQEYKNSFVTHFTTPGGLNASYFNMNETMPQNILTTVSIDDVFDGIDLPFFSLTLLREITPPGATRATESLFKLVSREEIPDADIERFLALPADSNQTLITWIDRQPLPRSVPVYEVKEDTCIEILEEIEIAPSVYYAGGGEQVVASAEFGCRMGQNSANLILDKGRDTGARSE